MRILLHKEGSMIFLLLLGLLGISMGAAPIYAADQNDLQTELLRQEEVANLTLVAESIMYGMVTGLMNGVVIGVSGDPYPMVTISTTPFYTYLYSRYRKNKIDEKSWMVEGVHLVGFTSGHIAGVVTGVVLRTLVTTVLEQLMKGLKLGWQRATGSISEIGTN